MIESSLYFDRVKYRIAASQPGNQDATLFTLLRYTNDPDLGILQHALRLNEDGTWEWHAYSGYDTLEPTITFQADAGRTFLQALDDAASVTKVKLV